MAKKKFDTNPLDPDFPQKVSLEPQPQQTQETRILSENGAADTNEFDTKVVTEEQTTRKFDEANFNQYQAPFNGQNVPSPYQAPPAPFYPQNDRKRKVAKIGLPENILTALPYVPFHIGLIAGIVELFIVPKSEAKVRFHAAQGVAAHLAIIVIAWILNSISGLTGLAFGASIFTIVTTIMLIIFAIKSYQGKPIHIEAVDDLTNWLEDKIKPSE